jgi:PPM family protein phosphatase
MIDDDEIARILMRHPENPAEQLVAAALDVGGEDNITVAVIGPMLHLAGTTHYADNCW